MRNLTAIELKAVSGAGACTSKNNNGYGNGAEHGDAPGRSGDHNPQLTCNQNKGPKGCR